MIVTEEMMESVSSLKNAMKNWKGDTTPLIAYAVYIENDLGSEYERKDSDFLHKWLKASELLLEKRMQDPDSAPYSMYDYLDAIVNGNIGIGIIYDIYGQKSVDDDMYERIVNETERKRQVYYGNF